MSCWFQADFFPTKTSKASNVFFFRKQCATVLCNLQRCMSYPGPWSRSARWWVDVNSVSKEVRNVFEHSECIRKDVGRTSWLLLRKTEQNNTKYIICSYMLQYLCTKSIKKTLANNPESLEHQIYSFRGTILGWMGSSGEASRNSRASTVCRTWPARPGARRSKRVPLGCGKTYLFANNWTLSSLGAKVLTYPAPPKKNINDEYYNTWISIDISN